MRKTFSDFVLESFSFLTRDYGFSFVENVTYEYERLGNGKIAFLKDKFTITVYKERLDDIYVEIEVNEKCLESICTLRQIITFSKDVEHKYFEIDEARHKKLVDKVKAKTDHCASLLLFYCQPLLDGNFSWWSNVLTFVEKYYPKIPFYEKLSE